MKYMDNFKKLWKTQSNQSDKLIKTMPGLKEKYTIPLSIEYKLQLSAAELCSDQKIIDKIADEIIEQDISKRKYAGKDDNDLEYYDKKIYKYESFMTQDIKLVPSETDSLNLFINQIYLGKLPKKYTKDVVHFLQSTIVMAFAYIKGGPYKTYDNDTDSIVKGSEPFDLNIYIQFS